MAKFKNKENAKGSKKKQLVTYKETPRLKPIFQQKLYGSEKRGMIQLMC